jgi:hypothetical protein
MNDLDEESVTLGGKRSLFVGPLGEMSPTGVTAVNRFS